MERLPWESGNRDGGNNGSVSHSWDGRGGDDKHAKREHFAWRISPAGFQRHQRDMLSNRKRNFPEGFAGYLTRCRSVPIVGMTGIANAGGVTCSCP